MEEENETKAKINKNQIDSSQSLARTGISLFPGSIKILFRKSVSVIGGEGDADGKQSRQRIYKSR